MEWTDDAIVLSARPHGEGSAIVTVLTRDHGRHAGLVRGARSKRLAAALQPGSRCEATWRGRLSEHLGSFTLEPQSIAAHHVLSQPLELSGLLSLCSIAQTALPEREAHAPLYDATLVVLSALEDRELWPALLVKWELGLLRELGFRLELDACAVTGVTQGLTHVSPKTGRAVCAEEAAPYETRLLRLPGFLTDDGAKGVEQADVGDGLRLSGHFLSSRLFRPHGIEMPEARERFIGRFERFVEACGAATTD